MNCLRICGSFGVCFDPTISILGELMGERDVNGSSRDYLRSTVRRFCAHRVVAVGAPQRPGKLNAC